MYVHLDRSVEVTNPILLSQSKHKGYADKELLELHCSTQN